MPGAQKDMAGGYLGKTDADGLARVDSDVTRNNEKDEEIVETPDGEEPNEREKRSLRRVGENLPASAFLIAIVELTERCTYYGAQGLFQNYISFDKHGNDGPRGLGMGNQAATGLNLFFQWFCYSELTKLCLQLDLDED